MPVTNATFVRTTLILLLVGLVTLLAILAASLWLVGRTRAYSETVLEVQQLRRGVFRVVDVAQDAETGQRGYLLTREDAYLAPYRSAVDAYDVEVGSLDRLVARTPAFLPMVERLQRLIAEKFAEVTRTVEFAQAGRAGEALAIVRTDRGKILMDEVRQVAEELTATVDARLAAFEDELSFSARALTLVLAIGGALIVLVVGGSTFIAWRYTRDLMLARVEVIEANASLEERVAERTADLARANEEIQRFAYIVSHDLRAPLVNIMGFTSELETGLASLRASLEQVPADDDDPVDREARLALEAEMPEAIGFIRSSTGKMDNLINAILKLSREGGRKLTREPVDMQALLGVAADSMRHQLGEGEIEVAAPMPDIASDRLALEQVFGNLIDNAVKYAHPSRPVRIVIRGRETRAGHVYEVEDNGRGIAAADQQRVFELFRRAGVQDRQGEGIGLSHVRALVRRLGGDIEVESELGRGATFRVRLPKISRS